MSNNKENATIETKSTEKLTMDYILEQIENIATDTEYLRSALNEIGKLNSSGPMNMGVSEKALALGEMITSREHTNQRLLSLYEKMYDDLKVQSIPSKKERLVAMLLEEMSDNSLSASSRKSIEQALQYAMQGPM